MPLRLFRSSVVRGRVGAVVRHRHRHVRRPGLDPALPADRQGRLADQGRSADPADGARHHGRLDDRRARSPRAPAATRSSRSSAARCWSSACCCCHTIGADTPLWQTDLYMVVFGAGLGLNMQTIVLAMQNAVPPRDIGVATSSVHVLPADRRHARHRGLPVDPVLGGAATRSARSTDRGAPDAGSSRRRPHAHPTSSSRSQGGIGQPQRHVVPRSSSTACSPTRSRSASPTRWTSSSWSAPACW